MNDGISFDLDILSLSLVSMFIFHPFEHPWLLSDDSKLEFVSEFKFDKNIETRSRLGRIESSSYSSFFFKKKYFFNFQFAHFWK